MSTELIFDLYHFVEFTKVNGFFQCKDFIINLQFYDYTVLCSCLISFSTAVNSSSKHSKRVLTVAGIQTNFRGFRTSVYFP